MWQINLFPGLVKLLLTPCGLEKKENNSLLFAECRLAVVWEGGGRDAETIYSTSPSPRSDQIRSVAQSCPTLCDPMNCSTPGLPVHHQLPEFTQTHVHRVSDAIQPSHPLPSPFPPAPHDLMLCLCRQENKIRVGMTNALFTQNSLILSNILSFGMQPLIFFIK